MKFLATISFLFLISFVGFSQTIRFNKTYAGNYSGLRNIEIIDDGYVGLGFDILNGKYRLLIIKVDEFGDTIWQKMYGDTVYDYYHGERNSLIKNTDGGYSLAGNKVGMGNITCMLTKFDENFDTLWTKYYFDDPDFTTFYNHIQTADGGYACVGYSSAFDPDGDILLVKTDSLGEMEWFKNLGTGAKDYGFCIVQTPDTGYLIGGLSLGYGGGDALLMKTDSLGNEEWTENFGHPTFPDGNIYDIEKTSDGGYVFMTRYALVEISDPIYHSKYNIIRLDSNFNLLWNRQYGILAEYCAQGSIIEANNGDILITIGEGDYYRTGLFRLTSEGDSIWKRYYYPPSTATGSDEFLFTLKQTQDNGFIMAGVAYGPQQMWLVKVDSCGCDTVGCICDYTGVMEYAEDGNEFVIFPNPADDKITFRSSLKIQKVEIIDCFGRIVKTVTDINESENVIDVSGLNGGLYIVKITSSNKAFIERVVVQH